MRFMYNNGGTPTGFHQCLLSELRLDYSAGGMSEHQVLCKFFELVVQVDLLNVGKSTACELLARKIQIIHDRWKHKAPSFNAGNVAVGGDDDSFLLLGTHETRGNVGICPELTTYLGLELGKLANVDKERRKAREERGFQLNDKKKGS